MAYKFNPLTGNLDEYGPILTGTGTVSAAADGTAALPGIAFTNDLNTGIYRPGADQLALSTNGTGRLFIDANGIVGAGSSVFFDKPTNVNRLSYVSGGYSDTNIPGLGLALYRGATGEHGHLFWSGQSTGGNGRVLGSIRMEQTIATVANGGGDLIFNTNPGNVALPNERLRITSAGLVGIGTSAPRSTFDLAGTSSILTVGGTQGAAIRICNTRLLNWSDAFVGRNLTGISGSDAYVTPDTSSLGYGGIEFRVGGSTAIYGASGSTTAGGTVTPSARFFIDSSGRVGIGTTSPLTALHVNASSGIVYTTIGNGNGGTQIGVDSSGLSVVSAFANNAIRFGNSSGSTFAETMRLDASGRLLVGTNSTSSVNRLIVQSSSDAPTGAGTLFIARGDNAPLTTNVLGALRFGGSTHVNSAEISAFRDGGTWTAGSSLPTGLTFSTTKDGQASPTEACRIDSSQRVLIGTSTGSHTLTVNGTSQIGASQQGTTSVGSVSSGVATTILTTSTPASGTKVIEVLVSAVAGTGNSVITARFLWQVNGQGGVNTRNVLRESITTSSDLNAGNRTYTNLTAAATTSGANEILQVTATHGGAIGFTSTLNVVYRTVLGSDYS